MSRLSQAVVLCMLALAGMFASTPSAHAQPAPAARTKTAPKPAVPAPAPEAGDADAEAKVVERFRQVLEKSPRRGTAFDRVYGAYVERGEIAKLVAEYAARTAANPQDGASWMVTGLIESQRGRDAAAVEAFSKAEQVLTDNPQASFYLGQSLVLVGKSDEAVAAFERAIVRKPAPTDLLEVFQALGRVHQRTLQKDKALAIWDRLERQFPNDPRVQEQIAQALVDEGQVELALPRFEKLATLGKDQYKQTRHRIQAAEIKSRLGKKETALKEFEALLAKLNPDNWLYRDVRKRIEEVFLRTDDQAGLTTYYEGWLKAHPDDVESVVRLAKVLDGQLRGDEARARLEQAIKLAPGRKDLRRALIEKLVEQRDLDGAAKQYAAMDQLDPNNPDILRDWGKLLLSDASKPKEQRREAAGKLWRRLLTARPDDPVVVAQVADLFRQSELSDDALDLYRQAIKLAPDAAQYREYLGEYLHILKRTDEALAAWREIAAGPRKTARNLTRLAEVLGGFGYFAEARPVMDEAVKVEPKDFNLRLQAADLFVKAEAYAPALEQARAAAPLATTPEEREAVVTREIRTLQFLERLDTETTALAASLDTSKTPVSSEAWHRLAKFQEANNQAEPALATVDRLLKGDAKFVPGLALRAKLFEAAGRFGDAAEVYRSLADIDRRYRTEYLTSVAKLEARLGRKEAALAAARDVIASAPGAPEHYEMYSQLCFQLGAMDEGLDALRRLVRADPTEPKHLNTLAQALVDQFRTDEAIELYWQAFDKSTDLDSKLGVVTSLVNASMQAGKFDRTLDRLLRLRREAQDPRETTICLAQAYNASGDVGTARDELEQLLTPDTRDTQLLQQVANLADQEGDSAAAVKFQEQLVKVAPGRETESRLIELLTKNGDVDAASAAMERLATQGDLGQTLKAIDGLLANDKEAVALRILEGALRNDPRNWELLYRVGVASVRTSTETAKRRFEEVLALPNPDDEPCLEEKSRNKPKVGAAAGSSTRRPIASGFARFDRVNDYAAIALSAGISSQNYYGGTNPRAWTPRDFGFARMGSLAWLLRIARDAGVEEAFHKERFERLTQDPKHVRNLWDLAYLCAFGDKQAQQLEVARKLAALQDDAGTLLYLARLPLRGGNVNRVNYSPGQSTENDATPPLPDDELDFVLAAHERLAKVAAGAPSQGNSTYYIAQAKTNVLWELRRAKRTDMFQKMLDALLADGGGSERTLEAMPIALELGDTGMIAGLIRKLGDQLLAEAAAGKRASNSLYRQSFLYTLGPVLAKRMEEKQPASALELVDAFLVLDEAEQRAARMQAAARSGRTGRSGNVFAAAVNTTYTQVYMGRGQQYWSGVQLKFPPATDELSAGAISVVRNAYALFERDDLLSDLVRHFRDNESRGSEAERTRAKLVGIALAHWQGKSDDALAALTALAETRPGDAVLAGMRLSLLEEAGAYDEALALVDSFEPGDQGEVAAKQNAVLRLALRSGDVDRARAAAERLFGLRQSAEEQLALVSQMRQLGMHEMAEAVLARAQKLAGRQTSTLVVLMQQYQQDGKLDVASQIAFQILRKTRTAARASAARGYRTSDDTAAEQALQLLGGSGKLAEVIKRTEEQLAKSPGSTSLMELLTQYYKANKQEDRAKEMLDRLIAARPEDAALRYQAAQRKYAERKFDEAVTLYTEAIKKDPKLLQNSSWEVANAFRQAKKTKELSSLMESIDLRRLSSNPYSVFNMIQNMLNDSESATKPEESPAYGLFKRAWVAFPDQRSNLLSYIHRDEFFRIPEMYGYMEEICLPGEKSTLSDPWFGLQTGGTSYSGEGTITTTLTRLIDGAEKGKKIDELSAKVAERQKRFPAWKGGVVLRASLLLRKGDAAGAAAIVAELGDDAARMPYVGSWVLAQEMLKRKELRKETEAFLVRVCASPEVRSNTEFSYSPAKMLLKIYKEGNRKVESRALLATWLKTESQNQYDVDYQNYRELQNQMLISKEFSALGYPLEGAVVAGRSLADPAKLASVARWYGNDDYFSRQLNEAYLVALKGLKGASDARGLLDALDEKSADGVPGISPAELLVARVPDTSGVAVATLFGGRTRKTIAKELAGRTGPGGLVRIALEGIALDEKQATAFDEGLARMVTERPDDWPLRVTRMLWDDVRGRRDEFASGATELAKRVAEKPLETLAAGEKANARQRAEAKEQLVVWLAATMCVGRDDCAAAHAVLEERAFETARRQLDASFAGAMLREAGVRAATAGDKAKAEKYWSDWLDTELAPVRRVKGKRDRPTGANGQPVPEKAAPVRTSEHRHRAPARATLFVALALGAMDAGVEAAGDPVTVAQGTVPAVAAPRPASARPATPAAAEVATEYLPLPLSRFERVMDIARLGAEHGLTDLGRKAFEAAFSGGPPLEDVAPASNNGQRIVRSSEGGAENSKIEEAVLRAVAAVDEAWVKAKVPAELRYELLAKVVFPAARPDRIHLYHAEKVLAGGVDGKTRHVGTLLVEAALAAKATESLRKAVGERAGKNPANELAGLALLVQVGRGTNDMTLVADSLKRMSEGATKGATSHSLELVVQAAYPSLSTPETREAALAVLEQAIVKLNADARYATSQGLQQLMVECSRHRLGRGQVKESQSVLGQLLKLVDRRSQQYDGEYGQYLRGQQLMQLGLDLLRSGNVTEGLEYLGQAEESYALAPQYGGRESMGATLLALEKGLRSKSARDRYALLRAWVFPTANRKTVRNLSSFVRRSEPPAVFEDRDAAPASAGKRVASDAGDDAARLFVSTSSMLVASAREAGKLDELAAELAPLEAAKLPGAETLAILVDIAMGRGGARAPRVAQLVDEFAAFRKANDANRRKGADLALFEIARRGMDVPELVEASERLCRGLVDAAVDSSRSYHETAHLRRELAEFELRRAGASLRSGAAPPLKFWRLGAEDMSSDDAAGAPPPWWVFHDGHLRHVGGPSRDYLVFRYPLSGSFEFSVDSDMGHWGEGNIGYAGLVAELINGGMQPRFFPFGASNDVAYKADVPDRNHQYNRIAVRVSSDKVAYITNGRVVWEDPSPSRNSPFLMLETWGTWAATYRAARITGSPEIPRSVVLVNGDTLEGWGTSFHGETQPAGVRKRAGGETDTAQVPPEQCDWRAEGGVVLSSEIERHAPDAPGIPSRLQYCRPLEDGDELSYSFRYEPERLCVHPALDRLAFLLTPEGVRLHWMSPETGTKVEDAERARAVPPSDATTAVSPLPLKENADNSVRLRLDKGRLSIFLNDVLVLERPLDGRSNRMFSFFRFKDRTGARISNVSLKGDWPEQLAEADLANLFATETVALTKEDGIALHRVIGDEVRTRDAWELVRDTRRLSAEDRYKRLSDWVLPGEGHPHIRFRGGHAPADEVRLAGPVGALPKGAVELEPSYGGGESVFPVIELVATARELRRTNELVQRWTNAPESTPEDVRAKDALGTILAIAEGRRDDMVSGMKKVYTNATKARVGEPEEFRWIEPTAALAALAHPATRSDGYQTLQRIVQGYQTDWSTYDWLRHVRGWRGMAWLVESGLAPRGGMLPGHAGKPLTQWFPASHTRAESRGSGWPKARWLAQPGLAMHVSGHVEDYLYYRQPLRGDFTVDCEITSFGYREIGLLYGGAWSKLRYDLKTVERGAIDGSTNVDVAEEQTKPQTWYPLRVEVAGGKVRVLADGKLVDTYEVPAEGDPWLAVHSSPHNNGGVRNLRIGGAPVVPESVPMFGHPDLRSWRPSYFGESFVGNSPAWTVAGDGAVVGAKYGAAGQSRQSLLRYHRPLVEDCEVEYEFLYVPGESEVHPALDRVVFLLEPSGVKTHWLTDEPWDRTGLAATNAVDDPSTKRLVDGPLPLKEKELNRLTLTLAGNVARLTLNGTAIAERTLEDWNGRTFGLFHYADRTEARVRNAVLRGKWGMAVPPVAEQELAMDTAEALAPKTSSLTGQPLAELKIDLRGAKPESLPVRIMDLYDPKLVQWTPAGVFIDIPPNEKRGGRTRIATNGITLRGDFDATARFKGLKIDTKQTSPGRGVSFEAILLDSPYTIVGAALISRLEPGSLSLMLPVAWNPLAGDRKYDGDSIRVPDTIASGTFRVMRRGGLVYGFLKPAGESAWRLIEQRPVGVADVSQFGFYVSVWDNLESRASVTLEEITIRAEEIVMPRGK